MKRLPPGNRKGKELSLAQIRRVKEIMDWTSELDALRVAMARCGISQTGIAHALEVSRQHVCNVLAGRERSARVIAEIKAQISGRR